MSVRPPAGAFRIAVALGTATTATSARPSAVAAPDTTVAVCEYSRGTATAQFSPKYRAEPSAAAVGQRQKASAPVHAPLGPHVRRAEPKSRAVPAHRAEQTVPMAAEAAAEQLVTVEGAESGGQRICTAGQAVSDSWYGQAK